MLLSLMRKHAKSWLIKVMIGLISFVFVLYFGFSFTERKGVKVALVNGEPVSRLEYEETKRRLRENLQEQYGGALNEDLMKMIDIDHMALENLINQRLINQEAKKIGLDVTEKEIQEEILAYSYFQTDGRFDERRYNFLLSQSRMTPEDFEVGISQQLLERKLMQFLTTFSLVTDQELLDDYTFDNERIMISYVQFLPKDYEGSVEYERKALEDYFAEHREEYRMPERIKIAYLTIDPNDFADGVVISDEEIGSYYEENIDLYQEERQVKARHILFKVDAETPEEEEQKVKERALSVLEKARAGEDFADLAKEYSEGPTSEEGGDLGYFSRGEMVKPFDDAAFGMEKGEISDLVRTSFGYHIIKVEDIKEARTKSLDEVKDEIRSRLLQLTASDFAHEKALSLIDQMPYEGVVLTQYAEAHQVPVKQTEFFASNESITGIGDDPGIKNKIFSLEKDDISELLEFNDKYYIVQVTDKKASYLAELREVEEEVTRNFVSYLATHKARATAEEYLKELKEGKNWEELAAERGFSIQKSDFFTREDSEAQAPSGSDFRETAFGLGEDREYPDKVFENNKGIFVIRWEGREGIDKEKFEQEKEDARASLMKEKQQTVFGEWLESLKNQAKIERLSM
ncbi:MAG: SurA N-terminal domain-containing protein [Deltaproteobacteria bacterium]|nr:SurA N-terminal domain-containing protein [Deltaproteobacteria bacterium]